MYEKGEPGLTMPVVLSETRPEYTREAMRAKIEGTVTLSCVVETDGTVRDVTVRQVARPGARRTGRPRGKEMAVPLRHEGRQARAGTSHAQLDVHAEVRAGILRPADGGQRLTTPSTVAP